MNIISGKEALIALANGEEVEYLSKEGYWATSNELVVTQIMGGRYKLRLKPRTITLNGIEAPAPFEPEYDDEYYHLDSEIGCGYGLRTWSNHPDHKVIAQFGAWRTEEEIKQIVTALRKVFKEPQQ